MRGSGYSCCLLPVACCLFPVPLRKPNISPHQTKNVTPGMDATLGDVL